MSKVITLSNGDSATLCYTFLAFTRLEDEAGINVFEPSFLKKMSPVMLRDLAWAGMLGQYPELKRDEAAKLIALDRLEELTAAVVAAMAEAMPKVVAKKPGK